jgi:hypothetical protein
MRHFVNIDLPKGEFRVICTKCHEMYAKGQGNILQASLAAEKIPSICKVCGGEVVLETNPNDEKPKYDKDHQYPNSSN